MQTGRNQNIHNSENCFFWVKLYTLQSSSMDFCTNTSGIHYMGCLVSSEETGFVMICLLFYSVSAVDFLPNFSMFCSCSLSCDSLLVSYFILTAAPASCICGWVLSSCPLYSSGDRIFIKFFINTENVHNANICGWIFYPHYFSITTIWLLNGK